MEHAEGERTPKMVLGRSIAHDNLSAEQIALQGGGGQNIIRVW
jgi:hypothetical protein